MSTTQNGNPATQVGALVARVLRGTWRAAPPEPDFSEQELERVYPLIVATYTTGLVWWRIRRTPLSQSRLGAALREQYITQAVRAAQGTHRVYQYVSALQAHGIDPIVFKGWALFSHFAEPGLRPAGDVDLAVPPEDEPRAIEILRALGATAVDVDVHPGLGDPAHAAYIPGSTWAELVQRSHTTELGQIPVRRLGPEDELQLLCIHGMRHLAARPIWLCDISAAIETRPPNFDWARALSRPPYTSWVVYGILLAHRLVGTDLANTPLAGRTDELPAWLVNDVLARWSEPPVWTNLVHESVFKLWRTPSRWQQAVRVRVPNRFGATIDHHGALDAPLLARYQLASMLERILKFAKRNTTQKHF